MINKVSVDDEFELYKSGMSIPEVHERTGIPLSTLRFRFKKKGILRSRVDGVRLSEERGRNPHKGNRNPRSDETKEKIRAAKLKAGGESAVGFRYRRNGYVEFTRGAHKGRMAHQVVMEKYLGRKLNKGEEVHHIDGNRSNNHISNLQVMSKSEHASMHSKRRAESRNEKGQFA